jgi:hypothetical protein
MKIIVKLILMIFVSLNLSANSLTKQQIDKLNNSVVKVQNNTFIIEEYNRINFSKNISFEGKNTDKIIIKTEASMKRDIINKEQFIAISSSISDSIMQSIFMNPQYFNDMKSIELLTTKPNKTNLTIKLEFTKKGLNTTVSSSNNKQNRFVSYPEIFTQRLK